METTYKGSAETYFTRLTSLIQRLDMAQIDAALALVAQAWQTGQQIITFGNGGSALTAQHLITDWSKSVSMATGKPFYGRSLVDNIGLVTAYTNDVNYESLFSEQLKVMMKKGDLVIGISGSGNSPNVLKGIQYANENGAITLGICGYNGGKLKDLAQHHLWVNVNDMQLSEDIHMIFGHIVMQKLCGYLDHNKTKMESASTAI